MRSPSALLIRFIRFERLIAAFATAAAVHLVHTLFVYGKFPVHDTRYAYETFYILYNSLINYREIPLWIPHIQYGVPSSYYLMTFVSVPELFTALAGVLLGIRDTLQLFYVSMEIELFILVFGAYLFGRSVFRNLAPSVFLSMSLLLSSFYLWQFSFDFRLFSWLPLTAFFLHGFVAQRDVRLLLGGGLCFALSLIGVPAYFLAPMLLLAGTCLVGSVAEAGVWRRSSGFLHDIYRNLGLHKTQCAMLASLLIVLAITWISITVHLLDQTEVIAPDRLSDGTIPTEGFISYGYNPSVTKLLEFLFVIPSNLDARIFVGTTALIFLLFGLIAVRRPMFSTFIVAVVVLLSLSLADATSLPILLYKFVPFFDRYRHIGLLLSATRFLILACAAFGLDQALEEWGDEERRARLLSTLANISAFLLAMIFGISLYYGNNLPYPPVRGKYWEGRYVSVGELHYLGVFALMLFLVILVRYRRAGAQVTAASLAVAAITVGSLELASYSYYIHHNPALDVVAHIAKITRVRPLEMNLWRQEAPPKEFGDIASSLETLGAQYGTRDALFDVNRCVTYGRNDLRNASVGHLWQVIGGFPPDKVEPESDVWSQWRLQQFGPATGPVVEPNVKNPAVRSMLGCVSTAAPAKITSMAGLKLQAGRSYAFYESIAPHPEVTFQLEKPSVIAGFQIYSLPGSEDDAPSGFSISGSEDGQSWQMIHESREVAESQPGPLLSWWFRNEKPYGWYRVSFLKNFAGLEQFAFRKIELRTEPPMAVLAHDSKLVGSMEDAEALLWGTAPPDEMPPEPGIAVAASSQFKPGTEFGPEDLLVNTSRVWHAASPVTYPQVLSFSLPKPRVVTGLSMLAQAHAPGEPEGTLATRAPADFTFAGSSDGKNWNTLLVEERKATPPPESWRSWRFPNDRPYSYYQLRMTSNYGDPGYLTIRSMRLFAPSPQGGGGPIPIIIGGSTPKLARPIVFSNEATAYGDRIMMIARSYNEVRLNAFVGQDGGWLIWREAFNSGWKAFVDGRSEPIVTADLAFPAVWLDAGSHQVQLRFGNPQFSTKYTLLGLLAVISMLSGFVLISFP